jgi:hypothetical protein
VHLFQHTSVTFEASVALYQLIKNQAPLVDGKELKFMQLLFALSGDDNKVVSNVGSGFPSYVFLTWCFS